MTQGSKKLNFTIASMEMIEVKGTFTFDTVNQVYFKKINKIYFIDTTVCVKAEIALTEIPNIYTYREYYNTGNLRMELSFIANENKLEDFLDPHGKELIYFDGIDDNGDHVYHVMFENYYNRGIRSGVWRHFHNNGVLASETFYESTHNSTKEIKYIEYFFSSGMVSKICEPSFGKTFYESGKLKAEWESVYFIDHGKYKEYYENGIIKTLANYEDGKRIGTVEKFFEDTTIKEVWVYNDGVKIYIKKFFPNGNLKSEWFYKGDFLEKKLEYDKKGNGILIREILYEIIDFTSKEKKRIVYDANGKVKSHSGRGPFLNNQGG